MYHEVYLLMDGYVPFHFKMDSLYTDTYISYILGKFGI